MNKILKFLSLYKDKTFEEVPLCEADILVGSLFSYASFENTTKYKTKKLDENVCPVSLFNNKKDLEVMSKNYINPKEFKNFLVPVLSYKRYKNLRIGYIKNYLSEIKTMQFFTFTISTEHYNVVFFRGTDVSLLGWKENFNMVIEDDIPSQKEAVKYLEEISKLNNLPFIIAGHSKGGNLAYYSYFNSKKEIKDRVKAVYNFDGPGFKKDNYDYKEFGKKLFKFVPYDDVIGIIFETSENIIPVDTTKKGLNSHDLLTWKFAKDDNYQKLKRKSSLTMTSKAFWITLNIWYRRFTNDEMKELFDFIVAIATCNQMRDLFALKLDIIKARKVYLDKIANYDSETKERLKKMSRNLVKTFFTVLLHIKDYNIKGEKVR